MKNKSFQRKTIYDIGKKPLKKTDITGLTISESGEVVRKENDKS